MKTILAIILTAFLLSGCENKEYTPDGFIPEGLRDCKWYKVEHVTIVRCPNSTTAVETPGKAKTRSITVG